MPKIPNPAPKKSDRTFISVLTVLVLVGATVIGFVVTRGKKSATSVVIDTTLPMPNAKGKMIGSDSAPIEIVMFGDFECPGCGSFSDVSEYDVRNTLVVPGIVRYRFADFLIHPTAMIAHTAAACANDQGKFWPMHDRIYRLRFEWSTALNGKDMNAPKVLKRYASELKLDEAAFATCLDSKSKESEIRASTEAGQKIGVTGTPAVIVGKRMIVKERGIATYDDIKIFVDSALADLKLPPLGKR